MLMIGTSVANLPGRGSVKRHHKNLMVAEFKMAGKDFRIGRFFDAVRLLITLIRFVGLDSTN